MPFRSLKQYLQSAADLYYSPHVPEYTKIYLKDSKMLKQGFREWQKQPFKAWSCPKCGITVNGPKTWLIQHEKQCSKMYRRDGKENELIATDYKLY